MQKVAARKEVLKQQHNKSKQKSVSNANKEEHPDEIGFVSLESKFLDTFHATTSMNNIVNICKYVSSFLFQTSNFRWQIQSNTIKEEKLITL